MARPSFIESSFTSKVEYEQWLARSQTDLIQPQFVSLEEAANMSGLRITLAPGRPGIFPMCLKNMLDAKRVQYTLAVSAAISQKFTRFHYIIPDSTSVLRHRFTRPSTKTNRSSTS